MNRKFWIGIAVYAFFFTAVALSTTGLGTKAADLALLSLGAIFWLVFSVYRITLWIKHTGRQPTARSAMLTAYPHWFARFAYDEDEADEKRRPIGLIDTV